MPLMTHKPIKVCSLIGQGIPPWPFVFGARHFPPGGHLDTNPHVNKGE